MMSTTAAAVDTKQWPQLANVLGDESIRQLSADIKAKLESQLAKQLATIDGLHKELAQKDLAAEQRLFTADREQQNSKSKLEMSEKFADDLKRQLRDSEELLQKSRNEAFEALDSKRSITYELNAVREKLNRFSTEKLDMTELLNRKQEEINHLQNELKTMTARMLANSEGRVETSARAEALELKFISVQHQEKRMSQERDLYQKQIQALNEELNVKLNELLAVRRERAVQTFELQSSLEQKTDENVKYLEEIKLLKQMIEKKDKHIESLSTRIGEIQHMSAQLEEDFHNETSAQNSLIDLHKEHNEELKKRNESMISTIEEMQRMLQSAKEAHTELESAFSESQRQFQQQLQEWAQQKRQLEAEIETLKESAETSRENMERAFQRQYPLAANTKKLLDKNMSFTQIFEEMVAAKQELDDEKKENVVLKEHLQQLATEAEENAPLLFRKIQEHQRAVQTIGELQTQMSTIMSEREQWLQEKDSIIRINSQFEREIQRYDRDNQNLQKQVRSLIRSVQEARGFTVSREQNLNVSSTVGDVPEELVTFKDIEELQQRNQELMGALREANEKLQKLNEEAVGSDSQTYKRDLDAALEQLEALRTERRQQTEIVETLVRQRDVYHQMVVSNSMDEHNNSQRMLLGLSSPNTSRTAAPTAEDIQEAKADLNRVRREYEEYRKEMVDRVKALQESSDKIRSELSAVRIELAKRSTELTFTIENNDMFKTNCEQFQNQNVVLKDRNTVLAENIKKHEQSMVLLRQETMAATERLNRLEMTCETLRAERDLHRHNEQKLIHENELALKTVDNQNKMIQTLQTVQTDMKQMENESMERLRSQNTKLESECLYLRNKCDKEAEKYTEANAVLERTAHELQRRIETEVEKYMKAHEELAVYQTRVQSLQQTVAKIDAKDSEIKSLREELKHWQIRANNLVEQLNKISPEGLKRLNEEKKSQAQISSLNQEINRLKQEQESQQSGRKALDTQIQGLRAEVEAKVVEARKVTEELASVRSENASHQNTITQLRKVARKYKQQFDEQKVLFDQLKQDNDAAIKSAVDQQSAQNTAASERQTSELLQKIDELNARIKDFEQQIDKLMIDLKQVSEEREVARGQAMEKEDRAKKIAQQAKQRLTALNNEKSAIGAERDSLQKSNQELTERIRQLETTIEESNLRMASIKSQFEAKTKRYERELTDTLKQLQDLRASQQQSQQQLQPSLGTIAVTSASVQTTSQASANPVRQTVHPQSATVQPLSAKSTPTASIRPLAVTPSIRAGRNVSARTAAVATVQPTTEDQSQHTVYAPPQATVQPTQTVASQQLQLFSSSTSAAAAVESEVITSQTPEEQIDEQMEPQIDNSVVVEALQTTEPIESEELITSQMQTSDDNPTIEPSSTEELDQSEPQMTDPYNESQSQTEQFGEPSTSRVMREKILLKRSRSDAEVRPPMSPKRLRPEPEEQVVLQTEEPEEEVSSQSEPTEEAPQAVPTEEPLQERPIEERVPSHVVPEDDDDDDVIVLESDSEEEDNVQQRTDNNEDNVDDDEEDEEEDEEEEDYDEEEEDEGEENVGESELYAEDEEEDDYNEEEDDGDGSHYEEEAQEQSDAGSDGDEVEVIGVSDDMPERNDQNQAADESQQNRFSQASEPSVVSTTSSASPTVTSSTETNPFMQIPTPIQRPFGGTSTAGRQSFYINQAAAQQSAYDDGDGIVPSTPTLFVPRRGDGFADPLNSPRVPQGRFVFSAHVPEAGSLSGLANETTLGVDDTRMDLSQFDDNNNGRSVPGTPVANSPAVDTQASDQPLDLDTDVDPNYDLSEPTANETIVPNEPESDDVSGVEDTEESTKSATNPDSEVGVGSESSDGQQRSEQTLSQTPTTHEFEKEDNNANKDEQYIGDDTSQQIATSSEATTSSSMVQRGGSQTARRGGLRGFPGPSGRGMIQRRPILPPTPPASGEPPQPPVFPPTQGQQPPPPQQLQPGQRTIRLGTSKFSTTRGNFRGRPSRGPGRGGRGGYSGTYN